MQRLKRKWTPLFLLLWTTSSCSSLPPRPDADVCVLDSTAKKLSCFNMKDDYNSRGELLPSATLETENIEDLSDLDRFVVFDALSYASLKAYLQMLRSQR
jgi:hypothetical protein